MCGGTSLEDLGVESDLTHAPYILSGFWGTHFKQTLCSRFLHPTAFCWSPCAGDYTVEGLDLVLGFRANLS